MELAKNIYRYRTGKNMSQGDLADALNVSRQSVSKWETGTAVPELEKLLKMSALFDVTLDELVGRSTSALPDKNMKNSLSAVPARKIAGTVLLCCAFLTFLVIAAAEKAATGLLWAIPFTLCGITCFVFQRHVGVWCVWALYLPLSLIPIEQYMRPDASLLIHLLIKLPVLTYTVMDFRRDPLVISKRVKWFLAAGYILWFVCFFDLLGAMLWNPPGLFNGFDISYLVRCLSFPLLAALSTVTLRILKQK